MKPRAMGVRRQQGAILLVSIIMLVVLTLFALSAIRLANVNLQIVGNFQWQKDNEVLVDTAIEQLLSDVANFAPGVASRDICGDGTIAATGNCPLLAPSRGTVNAPQCGGSRAATGYSKKLGEIVPEDSDWIIRATASDSTSGASIAIVRGLTARLLAGNCPE